MLVDEQPPRARFLKLVIGNVFMRIEKGRRGVRMYCVVAIALVRLAIGKRVTSTAVGGMSDAPSFVRFG